jgi:hypothetical protein
VTTADHDAEAGRFAVVLGRCDDMRAEVFVRYTPGAGSEVADLQIAGTLVGPRRGRDVILPVTARLAAVAGGGEPRPPLARAILTEPAFWTPELPNLYRLEAAVLRRGERVASIDRLVGLRRLGVRGRSLWLEGRRWVPRGIAASGDDLAACKAAHVAAVITEPDEPTLGRADELGVAVLAKFDAAGARAPVAIADRIATWAAHPCVAVVILPAEMDDATVERITTAVRGRRDTVLLARSVAGKAAPPFAIPPGIDALVIELDAGGAPHDSCRAGAPIPLIAARRDAAAAGIDRRPCDALQAALATWGTAGSREHLRWDWAGYVVG